MSAINRRGAAKVLGAAILGAGSAVASVSSARAPTPDPIVDLWAKTQTTNAEWDRVSTEQERLRLKIVGRNPPRPEGVNFADWYRHDPDMALCGALLKSSTELGTICCDLYDKISAAVATTPEGVRAKAAAALSLWVQEGHLREEIWHYDLILNALREAAAGTAPS